MSEQQRIFLAVALCLGIMLLWPLLMPEEEKPPAAKPVQTTAAAPGAPETTSPAVAAAGAAAVTAEKASSAGAAAGEVAPEPAAAPVQVPESRRRFETKLFRGEVSNTEAALTALELLSYNEPLADDEEPDAKAPRRPVSLVTAKHQEAVRQAQVTWQLGSQPAEGGLPQTWEESAALLLRGATADGVRTSVEIVPRQDAYAIDYTLKAVNESEREQPTGATITLSLDPGPKRESSWFAPPVNLLHGICANENELERKVEQDLAEDGPFTLPVEATWGAIDRQYFVVAAWTAATGASCSMAVEGEALLVRLIFPPQPLAPGQTWERKLSLFVGPKRDDALAAVSPQLRETIDFVTLGVPLGFLARPMVYLLSVFHGWTSSWGLAIMMLTLLVKGLLFPITFKSSMSMRKMQLLKPELDRLKKQFEGDRERQQVEQMKLFKEKGVNPLGGCIPMLLQMPVWFALYRTLWSAVDLYQQSFLWLPDLTAKEPLPIMALVIGGLTYVQQKLMPTATDSQQAKMMLYMMPVMLTVFMIALPSGLVLYILFNSILTLFQQLAINRRLTSLG